MIETTSYLFLSISLHKVVISVLTKHATYSNFINLNYTPTKSIIKISKLIYIHQWSFHKISLLSHFFFFGELQLTHKINKFVDKWGGITLVILVNLGAVMQLSSLINTSTM